MKAASHITRARASRAFAPAAALFAGPAAAAAGQPAAGPASDDARRRAEAAPDALGGAARLRSLNSDVIRAEGRGRRSAEAQGYDPEKATYFDGEAAFPPRHRRTIRPFFARRPAGRGLAPERIYGHHDRGFATTKHVRRVLAGEGAGADEAADKAAGEAQAARGRYSRGRRGRL